MKIKLSLIDDDNEQIDYIAASLQTIRYKDLENAIINNLWCILNRNLGIIDEANHLQLIDSFKEELTR